MVAERDSEEETMAQVVEVMVWVLVVMERVVEVKVLVVAAMVWVVVAMA